MMLSPFFKDCMFMRFRSNYHRFILLL